MMQKLLVRLQNKMTLVSLFSGVLLILTTTGAIDVSMSHQWTVVFNTVLGLLTGLGIVNDPESHVNGEGVGQ